jgi:hypothetical protein
MTAEPYDPAHADMIRLWADLHQVQLPVCLPTRGFIVEDAAYIGLEVVGDRAWLDPAVVDPRAPRPHRWAALGACLHAAETWARANGIKKLFAFTDRPTVARWVVKRGYRPAPGVLTSKDL